MDKRPSQHRGGSHLTVSYESKAIYSDCRVDATQRELGGPWMFRGLLLKAILLQKYWTLYLYCFFIAVSVLRDTGQHNALLRHC